MIVNNPKLFLVSAAVITSFVTSQVNWSLPAQVGLIPCLVTVLFIVSVSLKRQRVPYEILKSLVLILICLVAAIIFLDSDKVSEALLLLYVTMGMLLIRELGSRETGKLFKLLGLLAVVAQSVQALLPNAEYIFFVRPAMADTTRGFSGFFSEPSFAAAVLFILWLAVTVLRPRGSQLDRRFSFIVIVGLALTGSVTGGLYCAIVVIDMVRLNKKQLQLLAITSCSVMLLAMLEIGPLRIFSTADIVQDVTRDQSANARYVYFQKDLKYSFDNLLLPAVSYEKAFRNSEWADFGLQQPMNYSTMTASSIFGYFLVTYGFLTPLALVGFLTYLYNHLARSANRTKTPVLAGLLLLSSQMVSLGLYPIGVCIGAIYGVCRYGAKDK